MTDKIVVDGKVAVLYSPGYGAGWSTWATGGDIESMVFDPHMVNLVLSGASKWELESYAETRWSDGYFNGLDSLNVAWIEEGKQFYIREYDGSETVVLLDSLPFFTA